VVLSVRHLVFIFALLSAICVSVGFSLAQESGQRGRPTIEDMAKDGFEVKGISAANGSRNGYVVMMQRGQDVRTCLLRFGREAQRAMNKQSICL
jgi:hypothetical protein